MVLTRKEHIDLVDAEVEALLEKGAMEEAPLFSGLRLETVSRAQTHRMVAHHHSQAPQQAL